MISKTITIIDHDSRSYLYQSTLEVDLIGLLDRRLSCASDQDRQYDGLVHLGVDLVQSRRRRGIS